MRFSFVVFMVIASALASAESPAPSPVPSAQRRAPPGLEGLVWHKWDTDHFSVLSVDKSEGGAIRSIVEQERLSAIQRWGLPNSDDFYCKLVCVSDPDMLKKMFSIDEPRCEVRRRADLSAESVAIWIDQTRMGLLPSLLLEAELSFGKFPLYINRGLPALEKSANAVRSTISSSTSAPCSSITNEKKALELFKSGPPSFDADSAILCLMARREFGSVRFGKALRSSEGDLATSLGFSSQKDLDDTFARYRVNLLQDMKNGKTPDDYLSFSP